MTVGASLETVCGSVQKPFPSLYIDVDRSRGRKRRKKHRSVHGHGRQTPLLRHRPHAHARDHHPRSTYRVINSLDSTAGILDVREYRPGSFSAY